ncbi:MAG: hypothetical protein ACOWWH_11730 [Eubacteriaceae bacterium]
MKIQSSSVLLSGENYRSTKYTKMERVQVWKEPVKKMAEINVSRHDIVDLSIEGKALQATAEIDDENVLKLEVSEEDKQKIIVLQKMLEKLTGKKIKFYMPKEVALKKANIEKIGNKQSHNFTSLESSSGMIYEFEESFSNVETMSFTAQARVQTVDGKNISLDLELNMSRELAYKNSITIVSGDAKKLVDPLVINLDVTSAKLTDKKFYFDLDVDGNEEPISFLAPGSGFLALDINEDGYINDGSELFGTQSGDGFSDLSVYDNDNNGWIDENDSIYENLRIWTKDENGNDQLLALGQKGVGAIYLGNVQTDYSLQDKNNDTNGQIRKTGVYLNEDGTAGTIQHVDIVV